MRGSREPIAALRDDELIELFSERLPDLLERRPDLEPTIFQAFLKTFARREEVALVLTELRALRTEVALRTEMERGFEQVDQRFEQVDQRFERSEKQMQEFQAEVAARFEAGVVRLPGSRRSSGQSIDLGRAGGSATKACFDRPWRRCWSSRSAPVSNSAPSPASSSIS